MFGLLASLLLASPLGGPDLPAPLVLRDGDRVIHAQRLGLDRARLTWPDGRTALAGYGPHAIARLPDGLTPPGTTVVAPLMPAAHLYLLRSERPGEDGLSLAARLAATMEILPDLAFARRSHFSPPASDPRRGGQWYLDTIGIDQAWALSVGDPSVVIGVVDNGCDLAHPDLAANMLPGLDLVDNDDDPSPAPNAPSNEHGTACAGIIAAEGNNGMGVVGVCPTCRLRCVRLLPDDGSPVAISSDINAFRAQLEWDVAVSSNSWGFVDRFPVPVMLRDAITTLMSQSRGGRGAVVVFAAGNDHREIHDDELYGIPGLITVGAINAFDEVAQFSNFGAGLDIVAPTGSLTTDISGPDGAVAGDYMTLFGGTSAAAPVVAGVAGLLAAAAPDRAASELSEALIRTVRPAPFALPDAAGHDKDYGFGIVDPAAALAAVMPESEPEPEPEPEPAEAEVVEAEAEPEPRATRDEGCQGGALGLLLGLPLVALRRR